MKSALFAENAKRAEIFCGNEIFSLFIYSASFIKPIDLENVSGIELDGVFYSFE